jgi:hypothetical protein
MNTLTTRENAHDTLDIQGADFVELLTGALTHAGTDRFLHSLNAVMLESKEGKLVARATDRYRLIEGSIAGQGSLIPTLISADDVKVLIAMVKTSKLFNVALSRQADILTVSVGGNTRTVRHIEANYPPIDHLFPNDDLAREPIGSVAFNPRFFSDYAKIVGKDAQVHIRFRAAGKPMDIDLIGDKVTWRALLMPMRFSS